MLSLLAFLGAGSSPLAISALLTVWLAAAAVGLGIVAAQLGPHADAEEDLDAVHRLIDIARARLRSGEEDAAAEELRTQLQNLIARLPKDDLRRLG